MKSKTPLIVIVGPTASGKTGLAVKLAEKFNGEVISADSRAIYCGLDIGTAKPTREERRGVPHWGVDLVEPGQRYTAADFQAYAHQKIKEIRERGHLPILVGGTGLYVDAVVYEYEFPEAGNDLVRRRQYESLSLDELHKYCHDNNIDLPENHRNRRYVINSILRNGSNHKRKSSPGDDTIIVGITTELDKLRQRITERSLKMFSPAMLDEAREAGARHGWTNEAMTGNIYPLLRQYFAGELTLEQAREQFCILDWRLAKRQLTWLRRNEHIRWLALDDAYTYLAHLLAGMNK